MLRFARAVALLTLVAFALPARAQSDYPNKPITLVIALPAGGSNDIMARAVADKMSAALGQQIVVENRASAGSGTVTTRAVARGPADGYTLLLGYTSTLATGLLSLRSYSLLRYLRATLGPLSCSYSSRMR
jgi:tripartite-type tricarboxylate transporter receptor subunit TctC